jgi:hypothetical protein
MKVKQAIEVLQNNYNPEEDIFFDVYSRADLENLDINEDEVSDEQLKQIFLLMDKWATTDDFTEAVYQVLPTKEDLGDDDED